MLYAVGIGPGGAEDMTVRADRALGACGVIVGYDAYVALIRDRYPGKTFLTTGMTRETDRCRMALDEARGGKNVAVVCSGDSGVYGMAALLYQLRGEDRDPEIQVVPGLTAACSCGALLGAPLTDGFAAVSLSDRLTPWEKIETRLLAAVRGDFVLVLYNPGSRGRPDHLRRAAELLLTLLPEETPCGAVRNAGRAGEERAVLTLAELREFPADMSCTVFVGNSATRVIGGKLVTPRGYRDV